MAKFINRKCKSNLTADDIEQLVNSQEFKDNPQKVSKDFIDELMKKRRDKRWPAQKPAPNISLIEAKGNKS